MPETLHIEALVEDRSGTVMLKEILRDYFAARRRPTPDYELYLRPHKGLGHLPEDLYAEPGKHKYGLLNLLPAKLRAYGKVLDPASALIILVLDADNRDPRLFDARLERLCKKMAPGLPHVIPVAVEEMEAWLLGDWQALKTAYPEADYELYRRYEQDSVCGTWELLAEILLGKRARHLIKIGYPAVGEYKNRWAEAIAPYIKVERNRSPSLRRFLRRMDAFLYYREEAERRKK